RLQLVPGSDAWSKWKDIPVPIIIRFRIFNVTNPVAVQNGAKPKLVEAGPYAYEEKRIKDIIAVDSEKDTITYRQRIIYTFRQDLSNGTEYDRLVVINVPFVVS
ncbi:Sensory neuron membrane protein 2, partial [Orchesella cincta]